MATEQSSTRRFTAPEPLDLHRTLRLLNEGTKQVSANPDDGHWWATQTPDGPGSMLLRRSGTNIEAQAWGRGQQWMLDMAPQVVGEHDDPASLPRGHHDLVDELARRHGGQRFPRSGRVFEALFVAVLGQKIQAKMAHRSARLIRHKFGEPAPGPCPIQLLAPTADMATLHYTDLHPLGVERKRADIIINCAKRANRLEETIDMSLPDAEKRLLAFNGIGPWTTGLIMQAALGDADAVAVGDYHLPNTVTWALAQEPRGDDARMLELLEPYVGHRGRVTMLLKYSGQGAPKFGPRLSLWTPERL